MTARPDIAIVVQRYGDDVTGGSEALARAVAEKLAHPFRVTVFTTCARDYVTWRNELPEGSSRIGGVDVRRFRVEEERDLESFNRFSDPLYRGLHTEAEERDWLRRQGPYVPRLVDALQNRQGDFAALLYFTYLYYPTYWGLKVAPERSILVPTAHDEPPLRFALYQEVFAAARAFAFCSAPEEHLVRSRFPIEGRPSAVAGIGIEVGPPPDVERFRIRYNATGPYALYAGRIDAGKGCDEMLDFYTRYRRDCRGGAEMLLLGKLAMAEPTVPGVRYLGFLSEEDKMAAMAGARAIVCPSPYESLSIVLLEGLAHGTPGIVSARSPVLRDHVVRSKGGLYYSGTEEFEESLDLVVREAGLRSALGENGRKYVRENYRWDVVIEKYRGLIDSVAGR